jgi:glucose/arabinose dehydrogenase
MLSSLVVLAAVPSLLAAQGSCDNAGLKLPAGFCATIFADSVRGVRQLATAPNGDIFAAMQPVGGGGAVSNPGVMVFRDESKSGKATKREKFASGFGSSHVVIFDGYLYTEATPAMPQRGAAAPAARPGSAIVRFRLKSGDMTASGAPDTIVQDIVNQPGHSTRNFAITREGTLYMNIGSATNDCEVVMRAPRTAGANPCTELETRAGIWKFDARKQHQTPSASNHFARGIRNAVGITISPDNKLWTTQHGRDDLQGWYAQLGMDSAAATKYGAENPAEELMQVNQGDDFGWPYCYYSRTEYHLVLNPEYGGDGKKVGQCAQKKEPVATFPGHWAPNALAFYTGSQFPARYRSGAFIAFHGSWNRPPEPQAGYLVAFQPLDKNGKAAGSYEVFADNFSPNIGTGRATFALGAHRPTGLTVGNDGALYVADDTGGRIYRITYTGGK